MKPLALIVLDGWGLAAPGPGNAISLAKLEHVPKLWASYPHAQLTASGVDVGLPPGEDGNTETGHINLGAGRVVYQDLPRINMAITDGSFFTNDAFLGAIRYVQEHRSHLHLMGLISDAGVHSSREHLWALLTLLSQYKTQHSCECKAFLHLFTDGRDSPPTSAKRFVADVEERIQGQGVGAIATIIGRYYAMDRDHRWERTEAAYTALTEVIDRTASSAAVAIDQSHQAGKTDEFIEPTIILDPSGNPYPRVSNHDAVIFFNYRIDRPRQLTRAFVLPNFEEYKAPASFDPYAVKYYHKHLVEEDTRNIPFTRKVKLPNLFFVTMTQYERDLPCVVAYPPEPLKNTLGAVLSDHNLRQLRLSETEKERFVTYYFSGLHETPFPGEDRLIVPSPKVATYDAMPAMSAPELTDKILDRLSIDVYSFFLINLANPDMVAHTGNIQAAIAACEVTDSCVGRIVTAVLARGGTCVVTADHGNVEEMLGPDGQMDTEHSTFPVP
ncbi:MAG: 2,3-bisphosphoglycerate-independent phosphoglycerate mutase, partial [Patescibacteria group bacterium]